MTVWSVSLCYVYVVILNHCVSMAGYCVCVLPLSHCMHVMTYLFCACPDTVVSDAIVTGPLPIYHD